MLPMNVYSADSLIDFYTNIEEKTKEALVVVMREKCIPELVVKTYRPYFNDGDPCDKSITYIAQPNYINDAYEVVISIAGSSPIEIDIEEAIKDYAEVLDKQQIDDLKLLVEVLEDADLSYQEHTDAVANYNKTYSPRFSRELNKFFYAALDFVTEDNCVASIRLNGNTLDIKMSEYYPD